VIGIEKSIISIIEEFDTSGIIENKKPNDVIK